MRIPPEGADLVRAKSPDRTIDSGYEDVTTPPDLRRGP
jgi:hypothetical protein